MDGRQRPYASGARVLRRVGRALMAALGYTICFGGLAVLSQPHPAPRAVTTRVAEAVAGAIAVSGGFAVLASLVNASWEVARRPEHWWVLHVRAAIPARGFVQFLVPVAILAAALAAIMGDPLPPAHPRAPEARTVAPRR